MANLTRLSVLIGETDAVRSRETAELLQQLGVRHVVQVPALDSVLEALKKQAFDVLICAERLGDDDGIAVLRAARAMAPATRTVLMRTNDRAGEFVPDDIEAVELPFSRLELQGLLHRTAAPHGGLWCEVPELSLTDILQMYHQARRSITVLLSGPIAGRIWLDAGDIVDAEANGERGMPALSHLLAADSGLVRTEPPRAPISRTITAPFQSVILEAAQKLDERRRDSLSSSQPAPSFSGKTLSGTPPVSPLALPEPVASSAPVRDAASTGPADPLAAGAYVPNPFGGSDYPSGPERTSVSGSLLRPAMTPPVHAPAPSPENFLVPDRHRRQTLVTTLGVLLGLVIAGVGASYLGNRLGSVQNHPATAPVETALNERDTGPLPDGERAPGVAAPAADEPHSDGAGSPSAARAPAADAPATREATRGKERPATATPPGAVSAERPASSTSRAPERVAPPAASPGFELHITSKPSRATVSEGARVLGKTPLRLAIGKSSVANGPREFIVRLAGYLPVKVSQAASSSDVEASVVLSPRPAAVEDPDGGLYEPEFDPAETRNPKARKKDLGIRLRR